MPQNFIGCDREQAFLLPPSLWEWLPEDHLAWFVIEAVAEMDLGEFYADYRADGHGRAAYEPSMMVALLLYAYATEQRSARAIERHCRQDVAYRVICANRVPDHATIARFVVRHEAALAGLFGSVLALCARAGLVTIGVVAIDGTKLTANASREANLDYERIAREILAEAKATDEAEDELYGEARGDELPAQLQTREGRRRWLSEVKRELESGQGANAPEAAGEQPADESASMPRGRAIDQGRARLAESRRRLEEELEAERSANEAYEAYRARGISRDGRRFGGDGPSPYQVPDTPAGKINTTDPDSRLLKAPGIGYVQGYNARATVNEKQIVLAAEISVDSPDFGHLEPMVDATITELERAGVAEPPEVVVADAGYWHHEQLDSLAAGGIQVLIPPDAKKRKGARRELAGRPLRVDAHSALDRARPAVPNTLTDGRADVRAHQAQPRDEPLSPTRKVRRAHRMAPDHGHPQPHQAPPTHPGGSNDVNRGPTGPGLHRNRPLRHRARPRAAGFRDSLDGEQEPSVGSSDHRRRREPAAPHNPCRRQGDVVVGASLSEVASPGHRLGFCSSAQM
jgi:transposase